MYREFIFTCLYQREDVESAFYIFDSMERKKALCDFSDLFLLGCSDRFLRGAEFQAPSCFHLDKDQGGFIMGDDIDFSSEEAEPSGHDLIFFSFKIADGGFFPVSTQSVGRPLFFFQQKVSPEEFRRSTLLS